TVVGTGIVTGGWRAFRWTESGGMVDLSDTRSTSQASAVSADGSVVVGHIRFGNDLRAFRWTEASGIVDLGIPNSAGSLFANQIVYDVSGDGSVVVGSNGGRAFRWMASGDFLDLGA